MRKVLTMAAVITAASMALGADAAPGARQVSHADVRDHKVEITGAPGKALGEYSTIEGELELPTKSRLLMVVDALDGKHLDKAIRVQVEGPDFATNDAVSAALDKRYVLRGYETMRAYGKPRDPALEAPARVPTDQDNSDGMYGFDFWFQVTKADLAAPHI